MFFQNSVIKKYLAAQDAELIAKAWETYKAYFLNPAVQENIRASKEEQFQEGFLRELFVKVFGYTLNPMPDFNLITEQKNETDAKKADGAILREGKVIGVIELKDHKTTDLSHVERQAFGYKSQHKDTKYVVISNFEKLRFYIDNAVEHIEWNLFTITQEQFQLLYFCLSWANIQTDKPLKAKQDSVSNEDEVTQKLYKDYSAFKREIFADILAHNTDENTPKEHILLLFKKTQKLLDRLLFIFFAEDSGLLPPNSMVEILNQWEQLKEMDEYVPLYNRIKKYFGYMNTGWQGKKYEIFAYNGGLFKPDEVLDGLTISDELLAQFTRKLADYDYSTDVDVNILGHIFENSLNEIEEVTAQINNSPNGQPAPVLNRRKRDGVFYTPQYITKYIVENTVGKLCSDKKAEMGIVEQEYFSDKNRQTATKKRLLDQLTAYREWLLGITICDPACGSGAFLNAALQFLMAEHKLIDEMEAKLTGSELIFPNIENSILENNLYGVDINEESVEIARLALWLRTAKPHRKLSSLNNNIKCGNSLISDPEIAGEKAFNWQTEFPQVFAKGGFDVVIGNPPYVSAPMQVASLEMAKQRQAIIDCKKFKSLYQKWDLYIPFIELGIRHLCKDNGLCSMIVPYPLTNQLYAQKSREMLLDEFSLYEISDLKGTKVFEDAVVTSTIFFVQKVDKKQSIAISRIEGSALQVVNSKDRESLVQDNKTLVWNLEKIEKKANRHEGMLTLGDICYISKGMVLHSEEGEFTKDDLISLTKDDIHCREYIEAKDMTRYFIRRVRYLEYNTSRVPEKLSRPTFRELYDRDKIMINCLGGLNATLDRDRFLHNHSIYCAIKWDEFKGIDNNSISGMVKKFSSRSREEMEDISSKYDMLFILAIMNSQYAKVLLDDIRGGDFHIYPEHIRNIPIPECTDQQPFIDLADKMLSLNKDLQAKRARFIRRLQDNMPDIKITGTLETFDTLDFAGFVAELKKQKIKLSLVQQDEWEEYFSQYKTACNELTSAISATDSEIDTRVYNLYGLTDDEIKVIEG